MVTMAKFKAALRKLKTKVPKDFNMSHAELSNDPRCIMVRVAALAGVRVADPTPDWDDVAKRFDSKIKPLFIRAVKMNDNYDPWHKIIDCLLKPKAKKAA